VGQETYCKQKLRADTDADCQQFDDAVDRGVCLPSMGNRTVLHCSMCKGNGVKLDNEHWFEPLSVQAGRSN